MFLELPMHGAPFCPDVAQALCVIFEIKGMNAMVVAPGVTFSPIPISEIKSWSFASTVEAVSSLT